MDSKSTAVALPRHAVVAQRGVDQSPKHLYDGRSLLRVVDSLVVKRHAFVRAQSELSPIDAVQKLLLRLGVEQDFAPEGIRNSLKARKRLFASQRTVGSRHAT